MIAPGGEKILAMRRRGQRPGEDVVLSVIGPLDVEWLVQPDLDTDYDWLWAVDLNVWIVSTKDTPQSPLRALLESVRKHRPRSIRLWLDDTRVGYELWFYPTPETVTGPPDRWRWVMEATALLDCENEAMAEALGSGSRRVAA